MEAIIKEFQTKGFITNEAGYGKEISNAELWLWMWTYSPLVHWKIN